MRWINFLFRLIFYCYILVRYSVLHTLVWLQKLLEKATRVHVKSTPQSSQHRVSRFRKKWQFFHFIWIPKETTGPAGKPRDHVAAVSVH